MADLESLPAIDSDCEPLPSPASSTSRRGESLPRSDCDSLVPVAEERDDDVEPLVDVADLGASAPVGEEALPLVPVEEEALPSDARCCSRECARRIEDDRVQELITWRALKATMSNDDLNEFVYRLLLVMKSGSDASESTDTHKHYQFLGINLCRRAFLKVVDIGGSRLSRLSQWAKEGYMHPPRDLRHTALKDRGKAAASCETMFQWAYDVLAESLNSSDVQPTSDAVDKISPELADNADDDPDPLFCALPSVDGYREWVHGPGATLPMSIASSGEVRWLPPMALVDLYDLLLAQHEGLDDPPSYTTFTRVYNERFRRCLRFRPKLLHSKCDDCERFKLLRKRATTPEAAAAVRDEHLAHVKATFLDRSVDERVQNAAKQATTTPGGVARARSILNMDIDAMEAMKFKCPRNLSGAKKLATLWRPQQHMVCSTVDGVGDYYWLVPPDIVKNANLSATLTADMLHHSAGILASRGVPTPKMARFHSDNAGGEVKNQTYMKYAAWLSHNRFDCTEMSQFRVGHSHGRVDQKFTIVGTALNKEKLLETPDDFQACIEGMGGMKDNLIRRVTQLGALYDWKSFFEPLGIAPHGHVQTHAMSEANKEACHVFRFMRRDRMTFEEGAPEPESVFTEPAADDDIILVTKQYVASECFAQRPVVFCPGVRMRALPTSGPAVISGRVQFSKRQQSEFSKTASAVGADPWCMSRARDWLVKLLEDNNKGYSESWIPPPISRFVDAPPQEANARDGAPEVEATPFLLAPGPAGVAVQDNKPKEGQGGRRISRKRPAAASSSQRDQNLAMPSAAQGLSGAPPELVSEAGAPANVVAPRVEGPAPAVEPPAPVPALAHQFSARWRASLSKIATEPSLGCSKCRRAVGGCGECRRRRDAWRFVHGA